jgi:hypothetical protein
MWPNFGVGEDFVFQWWCPGPRSRRIGIQIVSDK